VNAVRLFANIEYEVDELRRDITVCKLAKDNGILPNFVHDKLIVEPGLLFTKQGKPYGVRYCTLKESQ
jgi:deoxyribodipyrimidine photo-lyase